MHICVTLRFPYCTIRYVRFFFFLFFLSRQQVCSWNKVQPPHFWLMWKAAAASLLSMTHGSIKERKNKFLVQCIKVMGRWMIAACTFLCLVESESKLSVNKYFSLFLSSLPPLSSTLPSFLFKKHYELIIENIYSFESYCFQSNKWKEEKSLYNKSSYALFISQLCSKKILKELFTMQFEET